MTIAEQIAARYDNDGTRFTDEDGAWIVDTCLAESVRTVRDNSGTRVLFVFEDDSAIYIPGDGWDIAVQEDDGVWVTGWGRFEEP